MSIVVSLAPRALCTSKLVLSWLYRSEVSIIAAYLWFLRCYFGFASFADADATGDSGLMLQATALTGVWTISASLRDGLIFCSFWDCFEWFFFVINFYFINVVEFFIWFFDVDWAEQLALLAADCRVIILVATLQLPDVIRTGLLIAFFDVIYATEFSFFWADRVIIVLIFDIYGLFISRFWFLLE